MAGYLMVSAGEGPDKPWRYQGPDVVLIDRDLGQGPLVDPKLTQALLPECARRRPFLDAPT